MLQIAAWQAIDAWDDPNLIIEDHCAVMFGESEDFKACMENLAKYNLVAIAYLMIGLKPFRVAQERDDSPRSV